MAGLTGQTFLPVRTTDNRVLGLLAIPATTFLGTETSLAVAGYGTVPLMLVSQKANHDNTVSRLPQAASQVNAIPGYASVAARDPMLIQYMSILATPREARSAFNAGYSANQIAAANAIAGTAAKVVNAQGVTITAISDSGWDTFQSLSSFIPAEEWRLAPGYADQWYRGARFLDFLRGRNGPTVSAPVVVPPTSTSGTVNISWKANFTNVATCAFFEVNWVEALTLVDASGGKYAASIVLGAPSADPSAGRLKATVVSNQGAFVTSPDGKLNPLMSTLRFVKTTDVSIPSGTYTWPATITSTTGSTTTCNLSIIIP